MKFWKYTWLMLTMTMSLFGLSACQDDDDYSLDKFAIEIMTVVPDGSTYYLRRDKDQLDREYSDKKNISLLSGRK